MTKTKLLERVRKLYAMAQDTSSPNEAAIAAKRARSLMDRHGLKASDLETSEYASLGATNETYKAVPGWYQSLAVGVARMNDCQAAMEYTGDRRKSVLFEGFEADVIGAQLMMDYLITAMNRQLKQFQETTHSRSARAAGSAFRLGFSTDMQKCLSAIARERKAQSESDASGTALVPMKQAMVASRFGLAQYKTSRSTVSDGGAHQAGCDASQRTNINRQVGGAGQRAIAG